MSRIGEWFIEQDEEHANDLMMCALAHEEELNRQEFEQAARRYPVVITPQAITHESGTCSAKPVPSVLNLQWLPPPPRAR